MNTLLLSTVVPSVSSADVAVTVILPSALSMTLVTRTWNKIFKLDETSHCHWQEEENQTSKFLPLQVFIEHYIFIIVTFFFS